MLCVSLYDYTKVISEAFNNMFASIESSNLDTGRLLRQADIASDLYWSVAYDVQYFGIRKYGYADCGNRGEWTRRVDHASTEIC